MSLHELGVGRPRQVWKFCANRDFTSSLATLRTTLLNSYEIISNPKVCTRENHTLDITLATQPAKENIRSWKAVNRLSSDHLPTFLKYRMPNRVRSDTGSQDETSYSGR